jgi:hypothetical protein
LRHWRRTIRLLKSRVAKFSQKTVREIPTVQAADRRKDIRLQSIQRELFLERGIARFDEERRFLAQVLPLF